MLCAQCFVPDAADPQILLAGLMEAYFMAHCVDYHSLEKSGYEPEEQFMLNIIEKVRKRATKLVITLHKIPYKDRLISLNLHTLKYRRVCGDMIEVFKIVNDIYDGIVALILHYNNNTVTRGNKFKLHNQTFTHSFRKHFFLAPIVDIWNSLPNWVVDVQSIDLFKVQLDRFWAQ